MIVGSLELPITVTGADRAVTADRDVDRAAADAANRGLKAFSDAAKKSMDGAEQGIGALSARIRLLGEGLRGVDTRAAGAALGLGRGFTFGQHVLGAKLRLAGDAVYDEAWLPQIAVGVQHKIADKDAILRAVGARRTRDTDLFVSATKVVLHHGLVVAGTARLTRANQFGLLGFGGDRKAGRSLQVEASVGKLLSPRLLVGAEYRSKPDNLAFAQEDDAFDLFAAWAVHRNVNLTLAYADLGDIATVDSQRGVFLSLQGAF